MRFSWAGSPESEQGACLWQELLDAVAELLASNASRRKPKIAKGTRDFLPDQMAIREKAFAAIVAVFKRHGAVRARPNPWTHLLRALPCEYCGRAGSAPPRIPFGAAPALQRRCAMLRRFLVPGGR